jgi:hypothetical protein
MAEPQTTPDFDPTIPPTPDERNLKHLGGGPEFVGSGEAEALRQSVEYTKRKRERGELQNRGGGDLPGELRSPEAQMQDEAVLERKYDHRTNPLPKHDSDPGAKTLREATRDLNAVHRVQYDPHVREAIEVHGAKPAEVLANAKDPKLIRQLTGWSHSQAVAYADRGEVPAERPLLVDPASGQQFRPVHDKDDIRDFTNPRAIFKSPRDATRAMQAGKDALAEIRAQEVREQERLRAELEGRSEQAVEQQRAEPAQQAQPQAQRPQAQPQQVDPAVAAERQRLIHEQERARLAQAHAQMSNQEREAYAQAAQLDPWAANHPTLKEEAKLRNLVDRATRGDVTARQELAAIQQVYKAREEAAARFQLLNRNRVETERALVADREAQRARVQKEWNVRNDEAFAAYLEKSLPQYSRGKGLSDLRAEAKEILVEGYMQSAPGVSRERAEQALAADWNRGRYRSLTEQTVLAEAATARLARKALVDQKDRTGGYATAVRPGVRSYSASVGGQEDASEDIARLQRDLANATGDRAVRISAKLTRAMRASGRL